MGFIEKQKSNRNGTVQQIAYDGTVQATNPFGSQTYQIRLEANSACHYQIGNGTLTATTADPLLPAYVVEYVTVTPGQNIAAIKAATNGTIVTATAGTLSVTELS